MKKTIKLTENELYEIIKESVSNMLSEARNIKSEKLYNIISQHNGIKSNRGVFDIHNMTDDDIINVINSKELSDFEKLGSKRFAQKYNIELGIADQIDYIPLNDGNYILAKCRGARYDRIGKQHNANREKQSGDFEHLVNKKRERKENRYPRKEDYVWNNDDARDVFHNPYFRKGEGNWTHERKQQVMNNIRKGKRWFDN